MKYYSIGNYIVRFLKSGIMEEGNLTGMTEGTPQCGIISPIFTCPHGGFCEGHGSLAD